MQDTFMSRWLSPVMAFCLSFIIIATLAPILGIQIERQLDFWLLWLATMLFLALPICYLEVALARRSKTTALKALSSLTRDADASVKWRLVGWLAVIFIPFLAGGVLSTVSASIQAQWIETTSLAVVFTGLSIVAVALSFISRQYLILIAATMVILSVGLSLVLNGVLETPWKWTNTSLTEWGAATVLALVASGLGMGLYWQSSIETVKTQKSASVQALPIWIAQLIAVFAFSLLAFQMQPTLIAWSIAAVFAAALMIQLAREQLMQRQINIVVQWLVVIAALAVWSVTTLHQSFMLLLMIWGLVICLIYAIFAGWMMKISHLRKSLGFKSELIYNLWRIAVRIVVPVSIVLALVAVLGQIF